MIAIVKLNNPFMPVFFVVMIMIGAFFLINLTLAIIKVKFSEANNQNFVLEKKEVNEINYDKFK